MTSTHLLRSDGYDASFELIDTGADDHLDLAVEFRLGRQLGSVTARSTPAYITTDDLRRLAAYLEEHAVRLIEDPDTGPAHTFVPPNLGFQLKALEGNVDTDDLDDEGEFGLLLLVDVGPSHEEGARVYVGGESLIPVRAVREFASSVRAALPDAGSAPGRNASRA